ncbi:glycosyltransferase family 4 protein [Propionibacterium australiense]|uniref:Glycosyltransferase n=1 Tax=Propionibacterium australiense TaxID=119981 RepID=A0A383S762_9ACTN|nr:glycosyltransferase family 4 protein [Propionibacterium australiense]RLP07685.1 glycosyltransferase [Propionibacterium australiense]RLP08112.1 glycosyltransferase [Propionibacterium australiense]SYZ33683.1 Glycosyltransferase subfamily 4-like, N-terminal domain [Propionibacterium australiense]VEH92933.1 GDP-mannose-dependent alpha-(1-6)-phosphatidylinositol monomannoside mannosyltransferase [Propionibacterium australiense]
MRIAYVSIDPGIPVFGTKGASVHVQEVVRELRRRGHQVQVHTTRRGHETPDDLADLPVTVLPVTARDAAGRERAQQEAAAEVTGRLLSEGVDMVYERYSLFSTVLAGLSEGAGVPGVLEVNAPLIDEQRTHRTLVDEAGALAALRAQAGAAAVTVCVSEPVRRWVIARTGATRVATVPNGVSVHRIVPGPAAPGAPVVVFVGTLKPWHGVEDLLQAAALAGEPWRLRIIGDGPRRAELERQAVRLGLRADFRGAVPPQDMPAHLAGAAIGVAPYPRTGEEDGQYFSPLKVYEYLAAGLPVVASRVGQLPAILDGLGVLVPPSDPAALAGAIDALAADPGRREALGGTGRRRAEERHSWAGVVDRIMRLAGMEDDHG